MPYQGLREFLEELLPAGELFRIAAAVSPELELAEITARVAASGGPALLFDGGFSSQDSADGTRQNVAVVTNLLGTEVRACRALGVPSLLALAERMANIVRPGGGASWLDRLRGASDSPPQEKFRAKTVRQGACQQAVRLGRDVDLTSLPAVRCWPSETAPALSGQLLTAAPGGEGVTLRIARGVVAGRKHLAFSVPEVAGARWHVKPAAARPAALVLGGDPAGWLAAAIDWAPIDGYVLAGLLRNQPWDVVPARSQPLNVPADAEMVIEGLLGPAALLAEAPPAESRVADPASGYYRDREAEPWLLEVTAITHRAHPLLPLWIVGDTSHGRPTGETATLNAVRGCLLRPLLAGAIPELVDVAAPLVGGLHAMAVLAIHKEHPGQARRTASALWGAAPFEATRWVIVVDADVDVRDAQQVLARVAANVAPGRDIFFQSGAGDGLDHAAPARGLVDRVGIDATAKLPAEHPREWPASLERPRELCEAVTRRWAQYGLPPLAAP